MSLDGFGGSDREHPGIAVPEGVELEQWKLGEISKAVAHLMGRVTYQEMSSHWLQSDDLYAAGVGGCGGDGEEGEEGVGEHGQDGPSPPGGPAADLVLALAARSSRGIAPWELCLRSYEASSGSGRSHGFDRPRIRWRSACHGGETRGFLDGCPPRRQRSLMFLA